jgi:uncharacterized protein (DUF2147 family)
MKKLYIAATALFLASTAAHAGNVVSFEIEGQKIHIQAPRNCSSLNCITILAPGLSRNPITLKNLNLNGFGSKDDDDDVASNSTTTPQPAPAPTAPQAPVQAAAPAVTAPVAPTTSVAAASPTPGVGFDTTTPAPAPAPVAAPAPAMTAPAPAPAAAPVAAAPAPAPTTPIGLWAAEENKGNVRVEQCGANLCGYAEKSGERILINMKPEGAKWSGRIHDPDSGRNYDSTIAMKGPNLLRVQGCAFGGMFCGGQTWKRVS